MGFFFCADGLRDIGRGLRIGGARVLARVGVLGGLGFREGSARGEGEGARRHATAVERVAMGWSAAEAGGGLGHGFGD